MRKAAILLVFVLLMLTIPTPIKQIDTTSSESNTNRFQESRPSLASAGQGGNAIPTLEYMSRTLNTMQVAVLNTYSNTGVHSGDVDLTGYLIPGWHMYKVEMGVSSFEAAPEREVLGVTYENPYFWILESGPTNYSQLAQGFYNQPFNGSLLNYSIYYSTDDYTPVTRGNASFYIMSDYTTPSAITSRVNMTAAHDAIFLWETISGESAGLDANSIYWAIINGSLLKKAGLPTPTLPSIYWGSEDAAGAFSSYINANGVWQPASLEPLFNYTYIPWNRTSNTALKFFNPESLSLQANSSFMTGSSWTFTNGTYNITSIDLNTNQSVYVDYDLTLWYEKAGTAATNWFSDTLMPTIEWNASTTITYPVVSGTLNRFFNFTVQSDWTPTNLYNGSTEIVGTYTKLGTTVRCTAMTDGTWTLSSSAPNYIASLDIFDRSDDSAVAGTVSNIVDLDINVTIEDGLSNPMNGGTTNLTILKSGSQVYAPPESTATSGLSSFIWDINATTTGNGTHSIEVFWTNDIEAGHAVVDVFVYYATTLVADNMMISAYTENLFDIGVNFDRISPANGLDSPISAVTYSFGATINASLTSEGGGRWTAADISTAGYTEGVYPLYVYAEGYALQNLSLAISVKLTHETQMLNASWSNTNDIAYLDSTNLSITYRKVDGSRIDSATVNVTFQGSAHNMDWDPATQTYWIELTGADFSGVPGTFPLNVSAWRAGYEAQFNDTITITIGSQTGEVFAVEYYPATLNISYIESLFIQVSYNYSLVPIDSNTVVRVTFNGSAPVDLVFNPISAKWETTLLGVDYLGAWNITVRATADGYETRNETAIFTVYEDTPILLSDWPVSSSATDYATNATLTITLTMSNGTAITDATISFTAFGTPYSLSAGPGGMYTFSIDPTETRGIETFTVTAVRTGYVTDQITLNLTVEATTSLEFTSLLSSEYEQWNLTIEAIYLDTFYSTPIGNATVTVTLDSVDYTLQYSAGVYATEIILDVDPGEYTIYVSASAEFAVSATNQAGFTVIPKEHVYLEISYDGNLIAGQFMEVIATLRSNNTGNPPIPGEIIRFVVSVYFDNGTEVQYSGPEMTDSTNADGVASVGFEVPFGNVDRLTAHAFYDGSRTRWATDLTENAGVDVDPLSLLLAFFMSGVGLTAVLIIALVGIVAAGYNRGIKPKKRVARRGLENQLQMFRDLETIQHFMAVYLDRGTCVFYHPFTEERIQPDLISGFIAAITSVYGEIKGDGVRGTLEEIQYHGLRLNSYSGQYIIGILILGGEMTPLLRERLQFFVELFENQYEKDLDGWTGVVDCFDPEWVVSTLNSAFNYAWHLPHRFGPTQKVTKNDAKMLDYIGAVRDERGEFYIKDLLIPLSEMLDKTPAQVLDRLLYLQDKGVILPIGIQTILQRQGLALVDGAEIPAGLIPEDLEYEPLEREEKVDEQKEEPPKEPEQEVDEMEAFVQDVESILRKEAEKEKEDPKKDDE